jgi:primosomal protein N' (replication factor Y)
MDTTTKKKLWQQTMEDFESGDIDILVGTQTITKGYHFPNVTLVGILWADLNLHFPLYYAAEHCLQQLIQVAGRAGRERAGAKVIVQTMMDHPIFKYINEIDYLQLYQRELAQREEVGYPPCMKLAEIELKHSNEVQLEKEALALMHHLHYEIEALDLEVAVLGPAKPPVHKIKKVHTRTLCLKGQSMAALIKLYQTIHHTHYKSSIFFTPDPL